MSNKRATADNIIRLVHFPPAGGNVVIKNVLLVGSHDNPNTFGMFSLSLKLTEARCQSERQCNAVGELLAHLTKSNGPDLNNSINSCDNRMAVYCQSMSGPGRLCK